MAREGLLTTELLTSARNPRIAEARRLKRRNHRDRSGCFLIEGPVLVGEALDAGAVVRDLFVTDEHSSDEPVRRAAELGVPVRPVTQRVVEALADTTTPPGIVAVVEGPSVELGALLEKASLVVVLADVRDPGNAGTLMRSALAAGADGIVFCRGSADPLHPKTVRAAAGSLFRLPLVRGASLQEVVDGCRAAGLRVLGADAHAPVSAYSTDLAARIALFLGNEAWGLPEASRHLLDGSISIPMPGLSESLNVGVAGSILLFEAVRQRRLSSTTTVSKNGE